MENKEYIRKALNVIQASREAGSTRTDIRQLLELEPINLALMETLNKVGDDETKFDEVYESMLPIAKRRLVEETLEAYGLRTSLTVDYKKIVEDLLKIENDGGRKAHEPRTVAGESLIITTLLAIASNPNEDLKSDKIQRYIEDNYLNIYEELIDSLKKVPQEAQNINQ